MAPTSAWFSEVKYPDATATRTTPPFAPIANEATAPTATSAPPPTTSRARPKPSPAATNGAATQIVASTPIVRQCTPAPAPTATPATDPTSSWIVDVGIRARLYAAVAANATPTISTSPSVVGRCSTSRSPTVSATLPDRSAAPRSASGAITAVAVRAD